MDYINRDEVIALLKSYLYRCPDTVIAAVEKLPYFPAPNPDEKDGRNVMGQTQQEFWDLVDNRDKQGRY